MEEANLKLTLILTLNNGNANRKELQGVVEHDEGYKVSKSSIVTKHT